MVRSCLLAFCAFFLTGALLPVCSAPQTGPLPVGWHDELGRVAAWTPTAQGGADISQSRRGILTLTLGRTSVSDPHTFSWASVSRDVDISLDEYPILAVRALRVSPNCWWDAIVQASDGGRLVGAEYKSDSLPERGLILFDVGRILRTPRFPGGFGRRPGIPLREVPASSDAGSGVHQHLRLRLNVAGLHRGGSVDYAWVRFIRREDAERLRRQPNLQTVLLVP